MLNIYFVKCSCFQSLLIAANDTIEAKRAAIKYLYLKEGEIDFVIYPTGGSYNSLNSKEPVVLIDSSIL